MRPSLENIELVDRYINGRLNNHEKELFERDLKVNAELQHIVAIQKDLIRAIQRKALRAEINDVVKSNGFFRKFWKWIATGLSLTFLLGFLFWYNVNKDNITNISNSKHQKNGVIDTPKAIPIESDTLVEDGLNTPAYNAEKKGAFFYSKYNHEEEEMAAPSNSSDENDGGHYTWMPYKVQQFTINPPSGATIQGENGTLVVIPSNAFMDDKNRVVKEDVVFELIEVLTLEDIVLYNLGTTSNGRLLETGGMLHFKFLCGGQEVKVDPRRPIYVEVPVSEIKKDMMVFKGEVKEGKMNWVDPQPLKKYLVNVAFDLLDFLPPGFMDTVESGLPYNGHTAISRLLADSLYYSLEFCGTIDKDGRGIGMKEWSRVTTKQTAKVSVNNTYQEPICCGINPISIKTIKTIPYAKTFIATKEFEERVMALHKIEKGDELLRIYVDNLNKNLSTVDLLVAEKLAGADKVIFENFAALGQTNVKDAGIYQQQLTEYYSNKHREYSTAAKALHGQLINQSVVELANQIRRYSAFVSSVDNQQPTALTASLANELPVRNAATSPSYGFQWAASGWINIDEYLHILSKGSEVFVMNISNKKEPMEVYQWLNTINNLTPLTIEGNEAKVLFPKRNTKYANKMEKTFCFAISKSEEGYMWFDTRYNPYKNDSIDILMAPSSLVEIKQKLQQYDVRLDINSRLRYVKKEAERVNKIKEQQLASQKKREEMLKEMTEKREAIIREIEFRDKLRTTAFSCLSKSSGADLFESY